jgi:hypothetical protein
MLLGDREKKGQKDGKTERIKYRETRRGIEIDTHTEIYIECGRYTG